MRGQLQDRIHMQIIRDTTDFVSPGETAVSIGKFDGVHLGHRRLLEELLDQMGRERFIRIVGGQPSVAFLPAKL